MPTKSFSPAALATLALTERGVLHVRRPDPADAWIVTGTDVSTVRISTALRLISSGLVSETSSDYFSASYALTDAGRAVLDEHGTVARADAQAAEEHRLGRVHSYNRGGHPVRGMRSTRGGIAECSCGERLRSNEGTKDAKDMWRGHRDSRARALLIPFDVFCSRAGLDPDGSDGTYGRLGFLYQRYLDSRQDLDVWLGSDWFANQKDSFDA